MLLGENFFPLLILAFGAGAVIGTVSRIISERNNPTGDHDEATQKAIQRRNALFIIAGAVMTIWASVTLLAPS